QPARLLYFVVVLFLQSLASTSSSLYHYLLYNTAVLFTTEVSFFYLPDIGPRAKKQPPASKIA
ncbi:hypothetical protein, partial [uncultured Phascolarctobacterium sp.]|uniref:hypothetical protein n=1 Tax=uncultured Phascolarctobacterium sp. TaxID=512296 RepID=UPI0025CD7681